MSLVSLVRRFGACAGLALALGIVAGVAATGQARAAEAPALVPVQFPGAGAGAGDAVRLNVYVDQRRNRAELKRITEDSYPGYAYGQIAAGQRIQVGPDSSTLMRLWKAGATITPKSGQLFESVDQFLPVFLVVDLTNDGTQAVQVTGGYLEVASSQSDLQPLILMGDGATCGPGGTPPTFALRNTGWGRADNASVTFAFGRDRPTTQSFQLALGSIGSVEVSVARSSAQIAPQLDALRRRPPTCPSFAQLPQCLARLERDGVLGGFTGLVRVRDSGAVITHLTGTLDYRWRDSAGAVQSSRSPIETDVPLFVIQTESPECGAGAPTEGGYRPIKLALDRANYTIALPYRGRLGPRENRRLEMTLSADAASRHLFRVVLETSDGRRIASTPVDLTYFIPRLLFSEPRLVR